MDGSLLVQKDGSGTSDQAISRMFFSYAQHLDCPQRVIDIEL
jgi:hypothetical protein